MIEVGTHVRVLEPFTLPLFPGVYEVTILTGDTATICGDRQFDVKFLAETQEPLEGWEPPPPAPVESIAEKVARLQAELADLASQL